MKIISTDKLIWFYDFMLLNQWRAGIVRAQGMTNAPFSQYHTSLKNIQTTATLFSGQSSDLPATAYLQHSLCNVYLTLQKNNPFASKPSSNKTSPFYFLLYHKRINGHQSPIINDHSPSIDILPRYLSEKFTFGIMLNDKQTLLDFSIFCYNQYSNTIIRF